MAATKHSRSREPLPAVLKIIPFCPPDATPLLRMDWEKEKRAIISVLAGRTPGYIPTAFLKHPKLKSFEAQTTLRTYLQTMDFDTAVRLSLGRTKHGILLAQAEVSTTPKQALDLLSVTDPFSGTHFAVDSPWIKILLDWQSKALASSRVEWLYDPALLATLVLGPRKSRLHHGYASDLAVSQEDYAAFLSFMEKTCAFFGTWDEEESWRCRMLQIRTVKPFEGITLPRADGRVHFSDLPQFDAHQRSNDGWVRSLALACECSTDPDARAYASQNIKNQLAQIKVTGGSEADYRNWAYKCVEVVCTPLGAHFTAVPAIYADRLLSHVQYLTLIHLHGGDMTEAAHAANTVWTRGIEDTRRFSGHDIATMLWDEHCTVGEINKARGYGSLAGLVTLKGLKGPMLDNRLVDQQITKAFRDAALTDQMKMVFVHKGKPPVAEAKRRGEEAGICDPTEARDVHLKGAGKDGKRQKS